MSPTVIDLELILAGIVLLTGGAWLVVESGSALAKRWGISPMWVGCTVVAIGTSLPEFTVTVLAAGQGFTELALTNVVGSNILNMLIVLGATAAIVAVPVGGVTLRRDLSLVVIISIGMMLLALDGVIHRGEGLLFLALVPFYIIHVYREEKRGWVSVPEIPEGFARFHVVLQWAALALGIVTLVGGGMALVTGAEGIATTLGVPERIIGLTVVAVGTSLPELATSLVAAFRRKLDLAIGNIIGSNILNILFVLGAAAAVKDQTVSNQVLFIDLPVMIGASLLVMRFAATQRTVSRLEGVLMLGAYVAFVAFVIANGG